MKFHKLHGLGNDYIYFTEMPVAEAELSALSCRLSNRHTGIGGDGIILALPEGDDFRMRIFNADGSEARMCGNGARCVGRLLHDLGLARTPQIRLHTLAGIKTLSFDAHNPELVTVDMGQGLVDAPTQLQGHEVVPVNVGNPHGVVFIDQSPADFAVSQEGPRLECDPFWADRANIEFAQVVDSHNINMRVWERGSGETQACGTGACAVALAAATLGLTERQVTVHLLGGDLHITILPDNNILMTGPTAYVFTGEIL